MTKSIHFYRMSFICEEVLNSRYMDIKKEEEKKEGYVEIARLYEKTKKESGFLDIGRIASMIDMRLQEEARRNVTEKETQEVILETQKYKQEIMTVLHERFKAIERKEQQEVLKGQRLITMKEGKFIWDAGAKTGEIQVTLGELLTDQEWGIEYVLDVESIPRQIQKRFAIEQAKFQLRELLNEQIILNETGRIGKAHIPEHVVEIYDKLAQKAEETRSGFLAERGARNFLKKMVIDQGLPVEILDTDIFQDVMEQIDFSIRSDVRHRGVDVESVDENQTYLGFQFTILDEQKSEGAERLQKKRDQINRTKTQFSEDLDVDDILLVIIPSGVYGWTFREWEKAGRPPGGPDSLWPKEVREKILRFTLVNFLSEEEIDQFVSQLSNTKTRKVADSEQFFDRKDSEKKVIPKLSQEQKSTEKKLSVVGSRRYAVAPQLVFALSAMQKRVSGKHDLQVHLQESIDSSEKRKAQPGYNGIKASEIFDHLNRVLSEAGLREIDPNDLSSIPSELASFLSKAVSHKGLDARRSFIINKLFPSRSG